MAYPYSSKKPRSLPVINSNQDPAVAFANWAAQLNPGIADAAPQPTPQNFNITNARGGLSIAWSPVRGTGVDGYELLKSPGGTFTDDLQIIPIKDPNQSTYFDSMGGASKTAFYRIRTTSGTTQNPQSARGPESGVIQHTSIDSNDTKTIPITLTDTWTSDATRSMARLGNYGAIKLSNQIQSNLARPAVGSSGVSSGALGTVQKFSSGANSSIQNVGGLPGTAPASPPPSSGGASGTPFSNISSGTNTSASMVVSAGASITPNATNPGTISATELQGTEITTTAPTNGQIPQYSATNGQLQYASIIATGLQANLQSALPLALGEIYVATDTGNLFIGTPGIGAGYLMMCDMNEILATLKLILAELRMGKLATISLDPRLNPQDFDIETDPTIATGVGA